MRTDPQSFIPELEERLTKFDGNDYTGGEITMVTNEGPAAVQELIDFLKEAAPVGACAFNLNLMKAARDHVRDTGPTGATGHDGLDGSSPWDRIKRYTEFEANGGSENISYGTADARGVIIQLAIDDGVASRGHRTNIFGPLSK